MRECPLDVLLDNVRMSLILLWASDAISFWKTMTQTEREMDYGLTFSERSVQNGPRLQTLSFVLRIFARGLRKAVCSYSWDAVWIQCSPKHDVFFLSIKKNKAIDEACVCIYMCAFSCLGVRMFVCGHLCACIRVYRLLSKSMNFLVYYWCNNFEVF